MKNVPHNRGQSYGYGGQYFDVYGGIDLRYYKGKHYNEIVDLYGGKYFIDDSRMTLKYKAHDYTWLNKEL